MALDQKTVHLIATIFEVRGDKKAAAAIRKHAGTMQNFQQKENKLNKQSNANRQKTAKSQKQAVASTKAAGKGMQDLTKAMSRALIVAPVWLAIRSIMLGVITTIKDGTKAWIDFDKALSRAALVIHGQVGLVSTAVQTLKEEVLSLSLETGQKLDKLTAAFYRFGTVGNTFEDSMNGMRVASDLAISTFGETEEVAKFLALTYRLLGDTVDKSIPQQQRLAVVGAQISTLYKDNAFQIGEMQQSFKQFLPTAKVFNISLEESLILLSSLQTAGLNAGIAGRTLRTAIQKMVPNLSVISKELGVKVNPALDSTFDVLIKTIGAIRELGKESGKISPTVAKIFSDVFGGVRSRQAPQALAAAWEIVQKNIDNAATSQGRWNSLLQRQKTDIDEISQSLHFQSGRLENLKVQIGKTFVEGLFGGTNEAADNLKKFNNQLEGSLPILNKVGSAIGGVADGFFDIVAALTVKSPFFIEFFEKRAEELGKSFDELFVKIKKSKDASVDELSELIKLLEDPKLRVKGFELDINLDDTLTNLRRRRTKLREEIEKISSETNKNIAKAKKSINLESIFGLEGFAALSDPAQLKFFQSISGIQIQQLKLQGLSETAAVKIRIANEKLLGVKKDRVALLKDELTLQQAIRKDSEKQLKTETAKLAQIGRTRGAGVAQEVSEVVQRRQTFEDFERQASGAAQQALNEFFAGFAEDQRNRQFLAGEGQFRGLGGEDIITREILDKQKEQAAIAKASLDLQRERALARFITEPTPKETNAVDSLAREIPKLTEVLGITQAAINKLNEAALNPNITVVLSQNATGEWRVTEINKDGSPVANAIDARIEKK